MIFLILSLIGLQIFTNISVDEQNIGNAKPIVLIVFIILTFLTSFTYQMHNADFRDKCGMYVFTLLAPGIFCAFIPIIVNYFYGLYNKKT